MGASPGTCSCQFPGTRIVVRLDPSVFPVTSAMLNAMLASLSLRKRDRLYVEASRLALVEDVPVLVSGGSASIAATALSCAEADAEVLEEEAAAATAAAAAAGADDVDDEACECCSVRGAWLYDGVDVDPPLDDLDPPPAATNASASSRLLNNLNCQAPFISLTKGEHSG